MNIIVDINIDEDSSSAIISGKIDGKEVYIATKQKDVWEMNLFFNRNNRKDKDFFVALNEVMTRVHACIDFYL